MQQQIDRVDHVTFIYRRENLEAARRKFTDALGIKDWDGPKELDAFDIVHVQSATAGVELIAPRTDEGMFADYIRQHGEGFFALIFGVADLEVAVAAAADRGAAAVCGEDGAPLVFDAMILLDGKPAYESWNDKFAMYRETLLQPVAGVNIYLGQIEPTTTSN